MIDAVLYYICGPLQRCVSNCMDRFMEAFNIVSQTYSRRLQQDSNMGRR